MKRIYKCLMLMSLIIMGTLISCNTDTDTTKTQSSDDSLTIIADNMTDYTIVRSDIKEIFKEPSISFVKGVREKTGVSLEVTTDWKDYPVAPHEIIIGYTNREGTEYPEIDRTGIDNKGYIIKVEGERLLIIGNTTEGTENGIAYFLENYVTESGISVPKDLYIVEKQIYPVKSVTLAGKDINDYVIVCDQTASQAVKNASTELATYIMETCGANLEIVRDAMGKPAITLDHTTATDDESFSITTTENGLTISGSPVRGLLYGTMHFIEEDLGGNFLVADTEYLVADENIVIDNIDYSYTPYFEYRDTYWFNHFDSEFSAKRYINSSSSRINDPVWGGLIGYTGRSVHTFYSLIGTPKKEQPCLSDPETYDIVLAAVLEILKEHPDARIISVSQNDNENPCQCERCLAIDKEEGSPAGTLLRFVNRIAEAVEKDYPNLAIHTLAYQYTRKAPTITKPRDNVLVQLCSIECCFNHALDDDSCEINRAFKEDMIAWSNICNRIYVWDYTTNYRHYLAPFPNFDVIRENVRFFHEHNVNGLFEQGTYQSGTNGELGDLRAYLLSKLMQNPYMSDEEYYGYMDLFLEGYYGSGWEYIRKYIDFITESSSKIGHFDIYTAPSGMFTASDIIERHEEVSAWFDAAEAAAETELQLEHVKHTRLSFMYLKCGFFYDVDTDEAGKEAVIAERKALFDGLVEYNVRRWESGLPMGESKVTWNDVRNVSPFEWRY